MFVRKLIAPLAVSAMVVSTWSMLAMSPAQAEPSFTPDANDIVGVGSDTTMHAMHFISEGVEVDGVQYPGYNELMAPNPADAQLVSYDAFGERVGDACPEVPLAMRPTHPVAGEVVPCLKLRAESPNLWRPNGSGSGKKTLFQAMTGPGADPNTKSDDISVGGASGNPEVNFARSSAPITGSAEIAANIWAFPFAFDGFKPGVRNAGSNAPSTISALDFLKIYKGEITNWSQIGGQDGVIKPLVPQPGSGTYQVFNTSMTKLNSGDAEWNKNPNAAFAQEHDPTLVMDDPNAVAPFSTGRAKAFASTVKILIDGWSVDRALFNVVRNADLDQDFVSDLLGTDGFLCSAAAQPLIEASGFEQLAPPALGGICGEPTQGTPTNFTTSPDRSTTTKLVGSATGARTVELTATINETGQAVEGSVEFTDAVTDAPVGAGVVSARQASVTLTGVAPGAHRYIATFTPDDDTFASSVSSEIQVTAKTSSTIAETFPAKVAKGKRAKGAITVTLQGIAAKATGTVKVMKGSKVLISKALSGGKVTVTLPALARGKNNLKITWGGNGVAVGSSKTFTINQLK